METKFHLGTWAESMSFSHNYTGRVFHSQGRVVGEESHDTCDPNLASPSYIVSLASFRFGLGTRLGMKR